MRNCLRTGDVGYPRQNQVAQQIVGYEITKLKKIACGFFEVPVGRSIDAARPIDCNADRLKTP